MAFSLEDVTRAHRALLSDERALHYCVWRGLTHDIIHQFKLGWVPPEESFNKWRGRVLFPIQNAMGQYVSWQGRLVIQTSDGQPKYLHGATDSSWHKSQCLFGFHQAMDLMSVSKALYTWEGPVDVCLSWALGRPAVACLGSSMSLHQAMLCAYLSQNVVVATDTDATGGLGAVTQTERLSSLGVKCFRLLLNSKDLGDIVQQHGKEAGRRALEEAEERDCADLGKRLCSELVRVGEVSNVSLGPSL